MHTATFALLGNLFAYQDVAQVAEKAADVVEKVADKVASAAQNAPAEFTASVYHWAGFCAFVVILLILDLGVFHRHSRETTLREAGIWTVIWTLLALSFNGLIWYWAGSKLAVEFMTGYVIEWSLSMDNVFVFAVIFGFFRVPKKYQYRVLFWGIMGAIIMRLTFVLVGGELIKRFDWVMLIFGGFLVYTGFKLAFQGDSEVHPDQNIVLRTARKFFPVAKEEHGDSFFVMENGRCCITPLFLVLLVVESTDVVFAVDSVPAIFGVTKNTFIVFTSNVFAILGLRALYFLLAGVMDMFRYLAFGLSAVLVFVGLKMMGEYIAHWAKWVEEGHHVIAPWVSLVVVISFLAIAVIASIIAKQREDVRKLEAETKQKKESDYRI